MKILIRRCTFRKGWEVVLNQGVQYFSLKQIGPKKADAEWTAKMLKKAIKNYKNELLRKSKRS